MPCMRISDRGAPCRCRSRCVLAGAAATDDPILTLPNVIATPHIGGVTESSFGMIAEVVADNIVRLRHGDSPLHRAV